jgi:hypothetical protein
MKSYRTGMSEASGKAAKSRDDKLYCQTILFRRLGRIPCGSAAFAAFLAVRRLGRIPCGKALPYRQAFR